METEDHRPSQKGGGLCLQKEMPAAGETAEQKAERYFVYFVLYSVVGWLYEVFLEVAVYRWGFSNRGVLFGPYCVIYGAGALLLIWSLTGLKNRRIAVGKVNITPVLVFLGVVLISTAVELVGSYLMELFTGGWMWDYRRFAFHFQGRIALNPSLRFGAGGMVFLYGLQPVFERLTSRWSGRMLRAVSVTLGIILLADAAWTFLW